jgi:hypothetical protein
VADPTGKGSAAMEARRTKFKDGVVEELPDAPADTRGRSGRRESPHAASCRAIDAARRDNDGSDPMPSLAPAKGPPVCTSCHRRKLPIGVDHVGDPAVSARVYCTEACYAHRWSPTPPTWEAFEPLPETKQEGTGTP